MTEHLDRETFKADLTISNTGPVLRLNKNSSGQANSLLGMTAGSVRWSVRLGNSTAEGGSNSGSDLAILPYDDTGAGLPTALTITRSTSLATVKGDPTAPLGIATKQYVDNGKSAAWSAPTLTNGWTNVGAPEAVAGYRKLASGLVVIKGLVKGGSDQDSVFTLPVGFRPLETNTFPAAGFTAAGVPAPATVSVYATGIVRPFFGAGTVSSVGLSINCQFYAEA